MSRPGDGPPSLLLAVDLTRRLGRDFQLVCEHLEVWPGQLVGIVGPNGAGKSTLLQTLAGLAPRSGGRILLQGVELATLPRRHRARQLAFVEQQAAPLDDFTVRGLVEMARIPHRNPLAWGSFSAADSAAVERALTLAGAQQFGGRQVGTLSGGERQRVFLARALAQEPVLLFLDEPTGSLDIRAQLEVLTLLRDLTRTGLSVVVVIHELDLAARYCDRIAIMDGGRVLETGPPRRVLTPEQVERVYGVRAGVFEDEDGPRIVIRGLPPAAPTAERQDPPTASPDGRPRWSAP